MNTSTLAVVVKSTGISQATQDLQNLAAAAANASAATANLSTAQVNLTGSTNSLAAAEKKRKLLEQKREMEMYNVAAKEYTRSQQEAISINRQLASEEQKRKLAEQKRDLETYNATTRAYIQAQNEAAAAAAKLAAEENKRKLIQQRRDLEMYNESVRRQTQATQQAAAAQVQANRVTQDAIAHTRNLAGQGSIWNNTLKSMIVAASAYVSVNFAKSVVQQADAWGLMQAKLKVATGSMEAAKAAQQNLYDIAQKLRIPLADSVQLYNRMYLPLSLIGKSAKETMGVVEGMGMALKLSGATAQEASSVMLQFSQSMNAGRLNGAEFNAVAEGAPMILRAIEAELKRVGMGAELSSKGLKKMGSEGKISSEIMANAILNANAKMRVDFEQLPVTVDGAITRIKNTWLKSIGEVGQDTGFNTQLSKSLKDLEAMIPMVAKAVGGAFVFMIDHAKEFLIIMGTILALGAAQWFTGVVASMITFAGSLATITAGLKAMWVAAQALNFTPIGVALTALGVVVGTVAYAYNSLAGAIDKARQAEDDKLAKHGQSIAAMKAETLEMQKQVDVIRRKNGEKPLYEKEVDAATKQVSATETLSLQTSALLYAQKAKLVSVEEELAKRRKKTGGNYYDVELKAEKEKLQNSIKGLELDKAAIAQEEKTQALLDIQKTQALEVTKNQKLQADIKDVLISKDQKQIDTLIELKKQAIERNEIAGKEVVSKQEIASIDAKIAEIRNKGSVKTQKTHLDYLGQVHIALNEQLRIMEELRDFGVDYKKSASEKELFRLQELLTESLKRKKDATIKAEQANLKLAISEQKYLVHLENLGKTQEEILKSRKAEVDERDKAIEKVDEENAVLEQSIQNHGKLALSKTEVAIADAEADKARLMSLARTQEEIDKIQELIDKLYKKRDLEKTRENQIATDKQLKKYEDDWQAANKKIADGLYEALSGSGSNFVKKLVKDLKEWFARLVLSPIIQPIAAFGASLLNPMASSAGGATGALSGAGGIGNMLSGIGQGVSNLYSMFTGGAGAAFNSFALSGMGSSLGLSSSTAAATMAAESAALTGSTIGAGTSGASLTSLGSIGSSLATIAPYLAAAAVLYKGLSMGEKQMTGQTVTGSIGENTNLSRNVSWTQEGGFLRKDRSGTWNYNLANSTAVADGVSYQDTASVKSDQALLKGLTSAYDVLKSKSAEYAKALGLNAEDINKRTDEISFAIGKTAEETQTNITKMFEDVGNKIATDILTPFVDLAKTGETSSQTLTRLSTNITGINDIFKSLGYNTYELSTSGVKAASALADLFGGLDAFQNVTKAYYDSYYTDAEKVSLATKVVSDEFKAIGKELPTSKDQLRQWIEAAKALGTEAGDKTYAELMKLTGAFDALNEATKKTIIDSTERRTMEAKILELSGRKTEALVTNRLIELDAMDASLRPLQERINILTDEAQMAETAKQVASSKADLEIEILRLTGKEAQAVAAERKIELAAMDESLRPLQQRIYSLTDEAAALVKATELSNKKFDLEMQVLELTDRKVSATTLRREKELSTMDDSLKPLQKRVWALQDVAEAEKEATEAAKKSAEDTKRISDELKAADKEMRDDFESAQKDKQDAIKKAIDDQASEYQKLIDKFGAFSKAVKSLKESLLTGNLTTLSPEQSYLRVKGNLQGTIAKAQSGDTEALGQLQQFLEISKGYNATTQAYTDDFNTVTNALDLMAAGADTQEAIAKAQLAALQTSNGNIVGVIGAVNQVNSSINNLGGAIAAGQLSAFEQAKKQLETNTGTSSQDILSLVGKGSIGGDVSYTNERLRAYGAFNPAQSQVEEATKKIDELLTKYNTSGVDTSVRGKNLAGADTYNRQDYINTMIDTLQGSRTTYADIERWIQNQFSMDGSHANGLDYVPFDGYKAELHKGEAVVTSSGVQGMVEGMKQLCSQMSEAIVELKANVSVNSAGAQMVVEKLDTLANKLDDQKRVLARQ